MWRCTAQRRAKPIFVVWNGNWFNNTIQPYNFPTEKTSVTYEEYMEAMKKTVAVDGRLADVEIIGTIMGLAVYNDTLIAVQFPSAMYQLLLNNFKGDSLNLGLYKRFDAESAKQLEYLANITDDAEFEALDMRFEVTQSRFDVVKEIELCPNGRKMKVNRKNVDAYIKAYIRYKMYSPLIEAQAKALTKGFSRVVSAQNAAFKLFNPDELELLLCGTPELDFSLLRQNSTYEGGYSDTHTTVTRFWEIISEMNLEQKKKLLKFSTGSNRAPIGGLKNVNFKVQRAGPDSNQLPTSHTCFNTLMLPDYSSKDKMRRLLLLAIENSEGFGIKC